jgi:hypothetical protein
MLAFTCHPASGADMPDGAQLMQRVKELVVQEMGITGFSPVDRKQTDGQPWSVCGS